MIASTMLPLLFSLITPFILEYLKSNPWVPFIQRNRPMLNAAFGAVVAVAQTVGISFAFDATAGTLTIGGLVLSDIARVGVTALLAWLVQEITYRLSVKP